MTEHDPAGCPRPICATCEAYEAGRIEGKRAASSAIARRSGARPADLHTASSTSSYR